MLLAVALGVEADFSQNQGRRSRDVVEAGKIVCELAGVLQEKIEAAEIGAGGVQIFGGGKIGIRGQAVGGDLFDDVDELIDEAFGAAMAVVADDIGGNLVGGAEGESGGLICDAPGRLGN